MQNVLMCICMNVHACSLSVAIPKDTLFLTATRGRTGVQRLGCMACSSARLISKGTQGADNPDLCECCANAGKSADRLAAVSQPAGSGQLLHCDRTADMPSQAAQLWEAASAARQQEMQ